MKRRSPERATEGRTPLSEADMDNGSAGVEFREMQTLRKELEECRRAVQKSADEMQAFAYSVSHDLRAPIRAIEGFSKIILEDFCEQVPAEAKKFLQHITSNTQLLSSQIEDLLRFYRLGKNPPVRTESDARAAVEDALAELKLDQRVEVGDLNNVWADPGQLRQIFRELLSNAAKASRRTPDRAIRVESAREIGGVTFLVRDEGIGFDLQHAGRLFQVFQKLHAAADFPGNGIGLAIAKRMVEAHGGSIRAESKPDEGSTFYFTIPDKG